LFIQFRGINLEQRSVVSIKVGRVLFNPFIAICGIIITVLNISTYVCFKTGDKLTYRELKYDVTVTSSYP